MTKQPPERFGWLFTKQDYYRDPDMRPNLDALQQNVDMTKDLGFVKASFDVKAHSDLSLIEEAAKRLEMKYTRSEGRHNGSRSPTWEETMRRR